MESGETYYESTTLKGDKSRTVDVWLKYGFHWPGVQMKHVLAPDNKYNDWL